jgi:hypothetical protein
MHGVWHVTYKTAFVLADWIYFTIHIHTARDYKQYSAVADLRTLGFSSSLVVSWQRIYNLQVTYELFFAQSNLFLAISTQLPSTVISSTLPNSRQLTVYATEH